MRKMENGQRQESIQHMVVERLAESALFFHDLCARLRIGQGPLDDPILSERRDRAGYGNLSGFVR